MNKNASIFSFTFYCKLYASAMVTSTSTPGSMLMEVICFTISEGLCKSISLLWILIWKRSQVLEPSPHGVLRVVMRRILVGMRTGPFTFRLFSFAPRIRSAHTVVIENSLVLLMLGLVNTKSETWSP